MDLVAARLLTDDSAFRDPKGALTLATAIVREHPQNGRGQLHLALAQLLSGNGSVALATIATARRAGADPACCTALSTLYWIQRKDRGRVDGLLDRLQEDLRQPNTERLRPLIVEYLRSLGHGPR